MFSSCETTVNPSSPSVFWQTVSQLPPIANSSNTYIPAGSVASLAVSSQGELFAGTENGCVYCSTDGGVTWLPTILSPDNSGNSGIDAMAITPNGIAFAGIASSSQLYGGLFASSDGGRTWYQTSLGTFSVNAIAIDKNSGYIYAGTGYESGVFRSSDYGVTWTAMDNGLTDPGTVHPDIWSLTVDERGDVFAGTASGEVFVSTNFGETWIRTYLIATSGITTVTVGSNQYVYAGSEGDSVYGSSDGGASWVLANAGIGDAGSSRELWSLIPGLQGEVFMGILSGGVYESADYGVDWNNVSTGIVDGFSAMAISSNGYLFAGGTTGYIYVSAQTQ
ncbi:MAG TPA: hypothetical protein VFA55_09330 [Candidatus Kapabacteria bacterium]|nr:hypothetical protein [Candidatus Kapabacteria bacterium]